MLLGPEKASEIFDPPKVSKIDKYAAAFEEFDRGELINHNINHS